MTPTKIPQYSQESLTKAPEAVNRGWSYKAVARVYGIPRTTLMDKHKGQIPLEKKMGPATAFSSEQENYLVEWLFFMEKTGFPVSKETFLHSVKKLATESKLDVKDTFPSKKWFYSFMKRHTNISQRICQNLTSSRRQVTESNILQWFKEIKTYFDDNTSSTSKDVIPSPFKRALFWPKPAESVKQRRKWEKIPSVVTSPQMREYLQKKEEARNRKEKEKEERKKAREEKKKLQETKQKDHAQKKLNRHKNVSESESTGESEMSIVDSDPEWHEDDPDEMDIDQISEKDL